MKFFNADGSVRRENNESTFGWVWKDITEEIYFKMRFYNSDGSVKSEVYYDKLEWKHLVDSESNQATESKETSNSEKKYQRMYSDIENDYKINLADLLITLNNKESHLLLSIISSSSFHTLESTKLRQATAKYNKSEPNNAGYEAARTLRLKKLYKTFDLEFNSESFNRQYSSDSSVDASYKQQVNKSIENYIDERDALRNILLQDDYQGQSCTEVDSVSKGIGIDKSVEPRPDIDQTLLKLFDKTCEMHCEVGKIRKCFLKYSNKMDFLLKEYTNLQEDIYETKFLNELILILDYKIERVNQNWPFRIGRGKVDHLNENLII